MLTFSKRICLILACVLLSFQSVSAQSDVFRWGITAGGNISKVKGDGSGFMNTGWKYDSSGGYFVGLTARVSFPILNLGIDASFTYSQEMADIESYGVSVTDKLRYFCIPMHLRYDFELPVLSEIVIPFAFAGPQVNLALNEFDTQKLFKKDPETSKSTYDLDLEYVTKKTVWKVDLGFGVILFNHVQLAYLYSIPLQDSFSFKTVYDDSKNNFSMGTHRICLTYYF